jgi:hypothetical protein
VCRKSCKLLLGEYSFFHLMGNQQTLKGNILDHTSYQRREELQVPALWMLSPKYPEDIHLCLSHSTERAALIKHPIHNYSTYSVGKCVQPQCQGACDIDGRRGNPWHSEVGELQEKNTLGLGRGCWLE